MHEHEFEKQVHQKLAALKLHPSEAVWENVEKRLQRKEKRRRWIILLPLFLIVLVAGGYLFFHQGSQLQESVTTLNKHQTDHHSGGQTETNQVEEGKSHDTANEIQADDLTLSPKKATARPGNKQGKTRYMPAPATALYTSQQKWETTKEVTEATGTTSEQVASLDIDTEALKNEDLPATKIRELARLSINTPLALGTNYGLNEIATKPLKRTRGWEWGLSLAAGRSSINDGELNSFFRNAAVSDVGSNFASGSIVVAPSELKPGAGISPGVFVKKALRGRMALTVGLGYNVYTTSNRVGTKIDSVIIVNPALQSNQSADKAIEEFFRPGTGNKHVNKYYFVNLPVTLQTKLTGNHTVPIYWNLGFSVSRLIASNALHFDSRSRIYYEDNDLFNKTQAAAITDINIRLFSRRRYPLQVGPQFQYGLTRLLKKQTGADKHLLFFGLKADVIIGKK